MGPLSRGAAAGLRSVPRFGTEQATVLALSVVSASSA